VAVVLGGGVVEDHVERLGGPVKSGQVRAEAEAAQDAAVRVGAEQGRLEERDLVAVVPASLDAQVAAGAGVRGAGRQDDGGQRGSEDGEPSECVHGSFSSAQEAGLMSGCGGSWRPRDRRGSTAPGRATLSQPGSPVTLTYIVSGPYPASAVR